MNYQYHNDGTNTRYTVNGKVYEKLEDVPAEHRAYFENMDKNKNGMPDNVEELFEAFKGTNGKASFGKVLGALFRTVRNTAVIDIKKVASDIKTIDFEEVKGVKEVKGSSEEKPVNTNRSTTVTPRRNYDKQGRVVLQGEKSFLPTLIKILVVATVIIASLWFMGLIH